MSNQLPPVPNNREKQPHTIDTDADDGFEHDSDGKEEKLKVVIRVRPLQSGEQPWSASIKEPTISATSASTTAARTRSNSVSDGTSVTSPSNALLIHENSVSWEKNGQRKLLLVDAVFDGATSQNDVFQSIEDSVDGLLEGYDCSIFAYGQTGTGKTHTMSGLPPTGNSGLNDIDLSAFSLKESFGIVPRAINKLFDEIQGQVTDTVSFSVYCSFMEIYNEKIYDILCSDIAVLSPTHQSKPNGKKTGVPKNGWNRVAPPKETPHLNIRQKLDGTVFVDGLTSRRIESKAEMLQAFCEGSTNREVRDNVYNMHSSRGHSIFQVTLRKHVISPKDNAFNGDTSIEETEMKSRLSRLFFVDLAGSEKWHVNGSQLSDKYASELSSINKSLSALTNCVLALTHKERTHIPFRDSALTRLLQSCLQGVGRTAFIVTMSPSIECLEESFATLRFAERLKALRCRPIRRKIVATEMIGEQRIYYEKQIQSMRVEVNRLRELLKKAHMKNQEMAEHSVSVANTALLEENKRLKELLMNSERNRLVERSEKQKKEKEAQATSSLPFPPLRQSDVSQSRGATKASTTMVSPQQRVARHILSSGTTSHQESSKHVRREDCVMKNERGEQEDKPDVDTDAEYTDLVNQLRNKEARLNLILEAEMEAQNTSKPTVGINPDEPTNTQQASATISRSWAVERALRRNITAAASVPETTQHTLTPLSEKPTRPPPRSQQTTIVVTPPSNASLTRQLASKSQSTSKETENRAGRRIPNKVDSPRPTTHIVDPFSSKMSSNEKRIIPITKPTSPPISSTSILQLVPNATISSKSKEELAKEYKIARRAELEAMLRTMTHH